MKLAIKTEHDLIFEATNPDESLKYYWLQQLRQAYEAEVQEFLQECAVTMRNLKAGEQVTVKSKPIKVTLSKVMTEESPAKERG